MNPIARRSRCRGDAGVTIVEAAFALPILLTFVFALVDLGMWTFNANQATNAARDGARVGILDFEQADVVGSDHHDAIVAAVEQHLDRSVDEVRVRCLGTDDLPLASCASAAVDVDRIEVEVEWDWTMITPVAAILGYQDGRAHGSTAMNIVGRPIAPESEVPDWTASPPTSDVVLVEDPVVTPPETTDSCVVTGWSVSEYVTTTNKNNSKQLANPVALEFVTNSSPKCDALKVRFVGPVGSNGKRDEATYTCGCVESTTTGRLTGSYLGSHNFWTPSADWTAILVNGEVDVGAKGFTVVAG